MAVSGDPIDGDALVLAAAKASVSGERLPELVDRGQEYLADRRSDYGRRYECAHETDDRVVFFVEEGHWARRSAVHSRRSRPNSSPSSAQ